MPFQQGRQKTGGRAKGTTNKDSQLKTMLHEHSSYYFEKNIRAEDADLGTEWAEKHHDELFSNFELDLMRMKATDRVKAEIELLSFHTPKMQAISADMSVKDADNTITERIKRLAAGEEIPAGE